LGLEYKDRFLPDESTKQNSRGALLKQTCIFVDMVPLFRDLADRSLGEMLEVQAREIVELVAERIKGLGPSLSSDIILPEWSQTETAVRAALYHLRHLSNTWKPILAYGVYNRSMCYLADVMFTLLLEQVTAANEISSSSCQFINNLFNKAIKEIEESILLDGDKSSSRVWNRFAAVGKFMDMSILDIQKALSDGVFLHVTGAELTRLVLSCFDDSPKRQQLLKLLDSADHK
jgi:centromere/kinetochore protein ZW10